MPIKLNLDQAIYKWQARHKLRMTYAELAKRAKITEPTIYRLSSGQPTKLDLEKLNRICKVLECDPGDLLDRVETRAETEENYDNYEEVLWNANQRAETAQLLRDSAESGRQKDGIRSTAEINIEIKQPPI